MNEHANKPESIRDKLFIQIDNYLNSSDSVTTEYLSINGVNIIKKFVCGSSKDHNITFIVSVDHTDSKPFSVYKMGSINRDLIEIKYLDRTKSEEGLLQITKNDDGKYLYNSSFNSNISYENLSSWDRGERINYYPMGRDMNSEELNNLLMILEAGEINKEYTDKSVNSINK